MENYLNIGQLFPLDKLAYSKLDKYDEKILAILLRNCRIQDSTIGKIIKKSKNSVERRRTNLEKKGIIKGYHAYVNVLELGYKFGFIFLKLGQTEAEKEEYYRNVSKYKFVMGLTTISGEWDCLIGYYFKDKKDSDNKLSNLLHSKIKKYEVVEIKKLLFTPLNYTNQKIDIDKYISGRDYSFFKEFRKRQKSKIDKTDFKLLSLLSENARLRLTEMGKKLNISRETVKYRIEKLIKTGVIGKFQPNCNPFYVKHQPFIFRIKLINFLKLKEMEMFISQTELCNDMVETVDSLIAVMHFSSLDQLRGFETDFVKRFEGSYNESGFDAATGQYKLEWFPKGMKSFD